MNTEFATHGIIRIAGNDPTTFLLQQEAVDHDESIHNTAAGEVDSEEINNRTGYRLAEANAALHEEPRQALQNLDKKRGGGAREVKRDVGKARVESGSPMTPQHDEEKRMMEEGFEWTREKTTTRKRRPGNYYH